MVQEEIPFKGFSYLELWKPFCSAEGNHLCNFSRGYYVEQFYEIFVKNESVVHEEMSFKKILYLELWWPSCAVERNNLCNLKEGIMGNIHVKLYEIWTSGSGGYVVLIHFLSRALAALLFSGLEPFVQFWKKAS